MKATSSSVPDPGISSCRREVEAAVASVIESRFDGSFLYVNRMAYALLRAPGLDEQVTPRNLKRGFPGVRCCWPGGLQWSRRTKWHTRKMFEQELLLLNQYVRSKATEPKTMQDATLLTLAGLAEIRDKETGEHLHRTRLYVHALALCLCRKPRFGEYLDAAAIDRLYKAAPLHDIGKASIPDTILLKPTALTPEETIQMRRHTLYGGDALRWAEERLGVDPFLTTAREIAYHHHEKWDGTGYPFGLQGDQIPISARLMALADVYDALITKRVYKEAYSHQHARDTILSWRGAYFDPDIVDAFLDTQDEFSRIAEEHEDQEKAA